MAQTAENINEPRTKLEHALAYARAGYRVFPIVPGKKNPISENGLHGGTRDLEQIRKWWADYPEANIGVTADGFLAVDVDTKKDKRGDLALDEYMKKHGHELPEGWRESMVCTPSGGWHVYLRDPGNSIGRTKGDDPVRGVDIRGGNKGYVVGVGSTYVDPEGKYSGDYTGKIVPIEDLPLAPEWLQKPPVLPVPSTPRIQKPSATADEIREWLRYVPIESTLREVWRNVIWAVYDALPNEEGLALVDEWSAEDKRPGMYPGSAAIEKMWEDQARNDREGKLPENRIRIGTLVDMAKNGGWKPSAKVVRFPSNEGEESLVDRLAASGIDDGMKLLVEQTDVAVGQEFLRLHGDLLAPENERTWRVWDGTEWITGGEARQYVGDLLDKFLENKISETARLPRSENSRANQLFKFFRQCLNQKKRAGILSYIATQGYVNPERFDREEYLLGLHGGQVLDLRTGTTRTVVPDDRVTKKLGTNFSPAATCPRWLDFLSTAMKGDASMIEFLQVVTGYFLTADVSEQKFFFFYGAAGAGKSTFLDTVKCLMGDYGKKVSTDMVLLNKWGTRSNLSYSNVADMRGARFTYTDEINDAATKLDTGQVKSLTGDAFVHGRKLHRDGMTFEATSKLVMYGNHKPAADFTDEGLWRRMCVVPFMNPVPASERDTKLGDAIRKEELPGVLNWAIDGYRKWAAKGLTPYIPATVAADSEEYQREQDNVTTFLKLCVEEDYDSEGLKSSQLYVAYMEWCRSSHEPPAPKRSAFTRFSTYFEERRIPKARFSDQHGFRYIRLKAVEDSTLPSLF